MARAARRGSGLPDGARRLFPLAACVFGISLTHVCGEPPGGCYISTGDNHWLASSLPIDSPASIEASFEFLRKLGIRRVYWRGLQEAAWLETLVVREENCRYAGFWRWVSSLYAGFDPDRAAAAAAHRRGMEIWGVSALLDWGGQADAPCSNDFPHQGESRLRVEHPEWVPIDRQGVLKQAGPVELAYPGARQALVDLHRRIVERHGYDGILFMTYAENYSMRFQDEFGYSAPIVAEFRKRAGIDITREPFTRTASRHDWYALRGEYVTAYLRELKAALPGPARRLGIFVNPQEPHFPQPWNVPELMLTGGRIRLDLETWVREGLVDRLLVYGYCHPGAQRRAVENCLWMARSTGTEVGILTSSPRAESFRSLREQGAGTVLAVHDEGQYLERLGAPDGSPPALDSPDEMTRLGALWAVARGKTNAPPGAIALSLKDANPLLRRAALLALGKTRAPSAVADIERGLDDAEGCVRSIAAIALRDAHGLESAARILAAVGRHGNHPLCEVACVTLSRIKPPPLRELREAAQSHASPMVRQVAMRALGLLPSNGLVPAYAAALADSDRYVRFSAAQALGMVRRSVEAAQALIGATRHEDPVVADRAAVSLGLIAERREREIDPLREEIAAALRDLYATLGDGCRRADAEWGYRPVGNALLKLGAPGEDILRGFMTQARDRRLAEQAWRSLFIRQDNGRFSEVTEAENEEAYRQRPAWLDSPDAKAPR